MRCMRINKQTIYYSTYGEKVEMLDEDGFKTGEFTTSYSEPVEMQAVISSSTGQSTIELFGNLTGYDRVITTDDTSCPIDEKSKIWIDAKPGDEADYEVIRKAPSLHSISYAVKQVAKNGSL